MQNRLMCQDAVKTAGLNESILKFYRKDGNTYSLNNKNYASLTDLQTGNYIKKRIYTIKETEAVTKPTGNTFRLRYK